MKREILLFLLISIFSGVAPGDDSAYLPSGSLSTLFNPKEADYLLLVGFEDQSIDRASTITSVSTYRRRGNYQSSTWSKRISDDIAKDYHLQKMDEWPMTEVGVHCVVYRVSEGLSAPEVIQKLLLDQRIKIVQKMNVFKTQSNDAVDPYFKLQSNLKSMHVDEVFAKTTGRNVIIGMVDTGVDVEHPDLLGQIEHDENFADKISPSFASDKHGTAIAGIMVAKKDNGTGITGVAPDAKLVALKACWPTQHESMTSICNSYTLALAVNNAIKAKVRILNMSLSGPHDLLLELLLNKAIENGIVVVAAQNGSLKKDDNFPASMPNVISVQSAGNVTQMPNHEPHIVMAPGDNILTTLPHGTYDFISGSSMAAAEVSGIVALLLELNPDLSVKQIKDLLFNSGINANFGAFTGINVSDTVMSLCKKMNCAPERLDYAWQFVKLR